METVSRYWEKDLCPIINGIIYADGSIKILAARKASKNIYIPAYKETTSINELNKNGELKFTNLYKRDPIYIVTMNLLVYCGETGFGGEGFVAVCEKNDNNEDFKWIALFDYSNPMEKVEYVNKKIVAYSNLGHRWSFETTNPENIMVEYVEV
jgi:hypothetical protein